MHRSTLSLLLLLGFAACSPDGGDTDPTDDTDTSTDTDRVEAEVYDFPGRDGSDSSVAYDGQIFRHLLVNDLRTYILGLTGRLNDGSLIPATGDVVSGLNFYYRFDSSSSGSVDIQFQTDPPAIQTTWDDVSTDKDLSGKVAGNDASTDHRDWSTAFEGWSGATSPEALIESWFDQLDAAAVAWANGEVPTDPDGNPVPAVYITAEGLDLSQLIDKFVRGAVAFSQGADDYLDDDIDGKGLLADHSVVDGSPYTQLEHQWDEAFGYFGAARDYGDWTIDEIAGDAVRDSFPADGAIDLLTEVSYGHSTNAAKRDRGSAASARTDLVGEAWEGFLEGRILLASTEGTLTDAQFAELQGWRDQAELAWEKAIAATALHYINDTLQDMNRMGTDAYSFADHAKHWAEMKGFALVLQFNPRSPLLADFAQLHALMGDAPVLSTAGDAALSDYADDLIEARAILAAAYDFDDDNLGDENGENGW